MNSKRDSLMVLVLIVYLGVSGCKTVDSNKNKYPVTYDAGSETYVFQSTGMAYKFLSSRRYWIASAM
jgi:hypothetical protein